jgi:hypothetical protein
MFFRDKMNAQELQQILQAARPAPHGRKVTIFTSGDGVEWRTWRTNFGTVADINEWNPARRLNEVSAAMEGVAAQMVADIDRQADGLTPAGLLDAFEARFLPPAAGAAARSEFKYTEQMVSETTLQWHARIRGLFTRAYPEDVIQTSRLLIEQFTEGLLDIMVKSYVMEHAPNNFANALELAQHKSSILVALSKGKPGAGTIGAISGPCWFCSGYGHSKRDCPLYRKARKELLGENDPTPGRPVENSGGRGRGQQASQGQNRGRRGRYRQGRRGSQGRGRNRNPGNPNHTITEPDGDHEIEGIAEGVSQLELTFEDEETGN